MTDEPKSLAHPAWPYTGTPWEWPKPNYPGPNLAGTHFGCICPPTSEQTCKNDKCPRK